MQYNAGNDGNLRINKTAYHVITSAGAILVWATLVRGHLCRVLA